MPKKSEFAQCVFLLLLLYNRLLSLLPSSDRDVATVASNLYQVFRLIRVAIELSKAVACVFVTNFI